MFVCVCVCISTQVNLNGFFSGMDLFGFSNFDVSCQCRSVIVLFSFDHLWFVEISRSGKNDLSSSKIKQIFLKVLLGSLEKIWHKNL